MKNTTKVLVILVLLSWFSPFEVLAESYEIEVLRAAQVNGVKLKPGKYRVTVNGDNVAELHRRRKLLVKASVETVDLAGATPNSISQNVDGELLEIRLNDQKLVFVKPLIASSQAR